MNVISSFLLSFVVFFLLGYADRVFREARRARRRRQISIPFTSRSSHGN